jgi:hypothetical protein
MALWLNLRDVYSAREGRASLDAVVLFAAFLMIGVAGAPLLEGLAARIQEGEVEDRGAELSSVTEFHLCRECRPTRVVNDSGSSPKEEFHFAYGFGPHASRPRSEHALKCCLCSTG